MNDFIVVVELDFIFQIGQELVEHVNEKRQAYCINTFFIQLNTIPLSYSEPDFL
jgi:hypothetical protein